MKIYTKTGDKGETSLIYGSRVPKTDVRVEAYGTCDEANSMIGVAVSQLTPEKWEGGTDIFEIMNKVQTVLFHVGAELATPPGKDVKWKLTDADIEHLEKAIDRWEQELPPLKSFVLPGGSRAGAAFHTARTIARRAERRAIGVEEVNQLVIKYLNRLSDFLFVAARYVNHKEGKTEPNLHEG